MEDEYNLGVPENQFTQLVRQIEISERQKERETLAGSLMGAQSEYAQDQTYELVETLFGEEYREELEERVDESDWEQAYALAKAFDQNKEQLRKIDEDTEELAQMNAIMSSVTGFVEDLEEGGK